MSTHLYEIFFMKFLLGKSNYVSLRNQQKEGELDKIEKLAIKLNIYPQLLLLWFSVYSILMSSHLTQLDGNQCNIKLPHITQTHCYTSELVSEAKPKRKTSNSTFSCMQEAIYEARVLKVQLNLRLS